MMKPRLRSYVLTALGTVICAWSAALVCVLLHGREVGGAVPLAFLAIVVVVAIRFGTAAGALGSTISALIFACFLYQPMGAISVDNPAARMNLAWLIMGGLACSYLLAPISSGEHRQQ
jgi:K+-sensing histidine kinase KdpD